MSPPASRKGGAIPMLDLRAQYASIREEVRAALDAVLESQQFILGPQVEALEAEVAGYCGRRYGIGVASGTDALILSLRACGVGPGDEVIVPAFSFIATASAVSLLGATPVFVDIQPDTFNIEPTGIEPKISSRTKVIIPVHLFGQAADMDPILAIAQKHGLKIIEDNAQSIGASYKRKKTGSLGDLGCLSFYPSKNLGGYGDGGMVLTDSEEFAGRLRALRDHGSIQKYLSQELGWNSRLDEMQAAVLRVKFRHLDEWTSARRAHAARYDALLAGGRGVEVPKVAGWGEHVYHQYTVRLRERDRVRKHLAARGIASAVYYPVPLHLQPLYAQRGYRPAELLHSERACEEVLSLPIYPELTAEQIERVAQAIREGPGA